MSYRVPFNRAGLTGSELAYIMQAIADGHISGDGQFTQKCAALLEKELGAPRVLLTTSCTHALEMAGLLLGLQPGDEIIVPTFTFVSTVNAFVLRGVKPVFCDIRPDTLNMDEARLERLVTSRTKAIIPVHYAGVGCEMDTILDLARQRNLAVVEDNAHGLFGKYRGRLLGTFGELATQSFHETKNFTCGEGGALVINEPRFIEPAEIIREKGTNRSRFFRGQVDKYTWVGVGSSYLPSDILAAFLFAQLEQRAKVQAQRRAVWERYATALKDWAASVGARLPTVPAHCEIPYHMFYLILPTEERRDHLMHALKEHGVLSVFHYLPLHVSDMGRRFGGEPGDCPVAENLAGRLLRLPLYNELAPGEQDEVCSLVREISRKAGW